MIDATSFAGLPIRTRTQRRWLVIAYYCWIGVFLAIGMVRGRWIALVLIPQTFILGAMLGGIQRGGPVKSYSDRQIFPLELEGAVQTLSLGQPSHFTEGPLDERERADRDAAHFYAYRILRWGLGLCALAYWLAWNWFQPWLIRRTPILLWMLLVVVLGLPQTVLLWTEPSHAELDSTQSGTIALPH